MSKFLGVQTCDLRRVDCPWRKKPLDILPQIVLRSKGIILLDKVATDEQEGVET